MLCLSTWTWISVKDGQVVWLYVYVCWTGLYMGKIPWRVGERELRGHILNVSYPNIKATAFKIWMGKMKYTFLLQRCLLNMDTFLSAELYGKCCTYLPYLLHVRRVFLSFSFYSNNPPHTAKPWQGERGLDRGSAHLSTPSYVSRLRLMESKYCSVWVRVCVGKR